MDQDIVERVSIPLLLALAELPEGEVAREGPAYAALMGSCVLDEFRAALFCLEAGGLVARGPDHAISATKKGREVAARMEALLAKARAAKVPAGGC